MLTLDRPLTHPVTRSAATRFVDEFRHTSRDQLEDAGLRGSAPAKGGRMLGASDRTTSGDELLARAKTTLVAVLSGDRPACLAAHHRELLTIVCPRAKQRAFDFLPVSTMYAAVGTWRDPGNSAHDECAPNVVFEVEYDETDDELIGDVVIAALRLINNLEVNEVVLYARMIDIEQSTLI